MLLEDAITDIFKWNKRNKRHGSDKINTMVLQFGNHSVPWFISKSCGTTIWYHESTIVSLFKKEWQSQITTGCGSWFLEVKVLDFSIHYTFTDRKNLWKTTDMWRWLSLHNLDCFSYQHQNKKGVSKCLHCTLGMRHACVFQTKRDICMVTKGMCVTLWTRPIALAITSAPLTMQKNSTSTALLLREHSGCILYSQGWINI